MGLLFSCFVMLIPASTQAAGVVPDGGTQTTVNTASNGQQSVNIAPAFGGVSHNTYSAFNVGAAGVTLNNTGINARTIVNQVTSTNPSLIEGALSVSGPRANVVIANPNGITVNGGSFINTGRVALTTGTVSFADVQIAPGDYQRNINLATTGGTIVVGPGGLSSALVDLDLIAKNIQINGPVANTFSSATAITRAIAGTSSVTLNTGLSPTDNANDWLTLQSAPPSGTTSWTLDITAAGSIASGRIELIVTDKGPGVRSAGPMNASLGDFTLSSAGNIEFDDASVTVAGNAGIASQDAIALTGSSVSAGGSAKLGGASISLAPGSGGIGSTVASSTSGVVIASAGDISNVGSLVQGQTRIAGDSSSLGAVTLSAGGNVLNQTLVGGPLGVVFGAADDVVVNAGGNVVNENARILSNNGVSIVAGGDLQNVVDQIGVVNHGAPSTSSSSHATLLILDHRHSAFSVNYGDLANPQALAYITAVAGDVTISANNVSNVGGSILSNDGAINIAARGALLNQAVATGAAQFNESCFIFCRSSASSTVQLYGGAIEAGTDITLASTTQITNTGGMVLALGNLTLNAPKVLAQGVPGYSAINEDHTLKAWFGNEWSAIYAADMGGVFTAGSGQVAINGEGDIDGGAISAPKGVHATNGLVTIRSPNLGSVFVNAHNSIGLVSWFGL